MNPFQDNDSSALRWLPEAENLGVLCPKTRVFPFSGKLPSVVYGDKVTQDVEAEFVELVARIDRGARDIGYPVFLRTDQASAKHDGPKSYRIESKEEISSRVCSTLEDNLMKDLTPRAFLVREFLDLESGFLAFGGHPIAVERRLFVDSKLGFLCEHPYWPADAIHFNEWDGVTEPAGWKEWLVSADQHKLPGVEHDAAVRFAHHLGGTWSVDFARDTAGKWWLIDAAVARRSWHPEDCPMLDEYPGQLKDDRPDPMGGMPSVSPEEAAKRTLTEPVEDDK